ncbi:protein TIFY 6B isoform X2 [Cicer arietinum]|uniref:Protein TIFY n=1 Tax=Cicer arietinum TaxID=3827 RepID=A0A1S3E5F2_CICAR|nr:protein TIFY 7 isoform X2 [Cicer arietinum]
MRHVHVWIGGFTQVSAVKWPFWNKVSAHSYLMPFNVSEEEKRATAGGLQKSFKHDGQGGIHYSLNPYPVQHNVSYANRPHDVKMFSVSVGSPFLKNHFATVGQNMNGANVMQPLFGGLLPVTAPHSVLPIVGTVTSSAEPCVKPSAPAPQLTIFYGGTVNVFNDITPETAQAIMLLAGNGVSASLDGAQPEVQAPISKFASGDDVPMSPPADIPPCSGISSPLSVSSHTGPPFGSGASSSDEFLDAKPSKGPTPTISVSKVETPKIVNATTMFPSAIPQARKASLARFLEKRKERVMSAAPYNLNKKSEDAPTPNSMVANVSATTGTKTPSAKQG